MTPPVLGTPLALEQVPFVFGAPELALVALASLIIFGILGPRMLRDLKKPR